MIKPDCDRYLLSLATDERVVDLCDYCSGEIYEGQEVYMTSDSDIVHTDCFVEFSIFKLDAMKVDAKEEY